MSDKNSSNPYRAWTSSYGEQRGRDQESPSREYLKDSNRIIEKERSFGKSPVDSSPVKANELYINTFKSLTPGMTKHIRQRIESRIFQEQSDLRASNLELESHLRDERNNVSRLRSDRNDLRAANRELSEMIRRLEDEKRDQLELSQQLASLKDQKPLVDQPSLYAEARETEAGTEAARRRIRFARSNAEDIRSQLEAMFKSQKPAQHVMIRQRADIVTIGLTRSLVNRLQGDVLKALEIAQKSLQWAEPIGNPYLTGLCRYYCGAAEMTLARYETAMTSLAGAEICKLHYAEGEQIQRDLDRCKKKLKNRATSELSARVSELQDAETDLTDLALSAQANNWSSGDEFHEASDGLETVQIQAVDQSAAEKSLSEYDTRQPASNTYDLDQAKRSPPYRRHTRVSSLRKRPAPLKAIRSGRNKSALSSLNSGTSSSGSPDRSPNSSNQNALFDAEGSKTTRGPQSAPYRRTVFQSVNSTFGPRPGNLDIQFARPRSASAVSHPRRRRAPMNRHDLRPVNPRSKQSDTLPKATNTSPSEVIDGSMRSASMTSPEDSQQALLSAGLLQSATNLANELEDLDEDTMFSFAQGSSQGSSKSVGTVVGPHSPGDVHRDNLSIEAKPIASPTPSRPGFNASPYLEQQVITTVRCTRGSNRATTATSPPYGASSHSPPFPSPSSLSSGSSSTSSPRKSDFTHRRQTSFMGIVKVLASPFLSSSFEGGRVDEEEGVEDQHADGESVRPSSDGWRPDTVVSRGKAGGHGYAEGMV